MNVLKKLILTSALLLTIHPLFAVTTLTASEKNTLAIIAVIDKSEIIAGVVANNRNVSADIKAFAQMMIDQHGSNLTQILKMANKNLPLHSGLAATLALQNGKELLQIGDLPADKFGIAYVNAMVKGHQAALNLIDTKLAKTASTPAMKKFIVDTRAAVAMHLAHAQSLKSKMKNS